MITKKRFLLFFLLIAVYVIILTPFLYGAYIAAYYKIAEIHDLTVKYRLEDQMVASKTIPEGMNNLYVCGTITSGSSNYLVISLLSEDEKIFYGKDNTDSPYPLGDFCAEIKIKTSLMSGKYKIIIIDSHKRVGELLFQVK